MGNRYRPAACLVLSCALMAQSFPGWAQVASVSAPAPAPAAPGVPVIVQSPSAPGVRATAPSVFAPAPLPVIVGVPVSAGPGLLPSVQAALSPASGLAAVQPGAAALRPGAASARRADLALAKVAAAAAREARTPATGRLGALQGLSLKRTPKSEALQPGENDFARHVWDHAKAKGFVEGSQDELLPSGKPVLFPPLHLDPAENPRPAAKSAAAAVASPAPAQAKRDRTTLHGFLANLGALQFGVGAMALVVPQLAKSLSGSFLGLSAVSISSLLASSLGSAVGGPLVDRFGIRKVYLGVLALRVASAAAMAQLFFAGALGLPALTLLFALDYMLQGAGRVAEATLPAALYGSEPLKINRFGTLQQVVMEGTDIVGPILAGALIGAAGFGPVLALFPALLAAGLAITFFTVKPPRASHEGEGFERGKIAAAMKALWAEPTVRRAFIASTVTSTIIYSIVFMVAPAFGLFVKGNPEAGSAVTAMIESLFCAGAFASTWVGAWLTARSEKKVGALPEVARAEAGEAAFLRMARGWLVAAAVTALGFWAFLLGAPVAGILPVYLVLPFMGLSATGAAVHLDTILKSKAPDGMGGTLLGIARAAGLLVTTLVSLGLGLILDAFSVSSAGIALPTAAAFVAIGILATLAAAVYWRVAAALKG